MLDPPSTKRTACRELADHLPVQGAFAISKSQQAQPPKMEPFTIRMTACGEIADASHPVHSTNIAT
jgi:hypothetical protein